MGCLWLRTLDKWECCWRRTSENYQWVVLNMSCPTTAAMVGEDNTSVPPSSRALLLGITPVISQLPTFSTFTTHFSCLLNWRVCGLGRGLKMRAVIRHGLTVLTSVCVMRQYGVQIGLFHTLCIILYVTSCLFLFGTESFKLWVSH